MKKTLLFVALSLPILGFSQSLTQANEATIGTTASMHLCDSFTVTYDGIVGPAVIWDYTQLVGYPAEFRDVSVVDPASTSYAGDFTGSTFALKVGANLTTYFSSTAADRRSQGFVFSEPSLGDILAKFTTDDELVATYPFAQGNVVTDIFSGDLVSLLGTTPANGVAYATIDGQGTLQLPGAVTLTNVIRYKIVDTSWATITGLGNLEFIRNQYEYYDHSVSNLPVLMISTIIVQNQGAGNPVAAETLVLSQYTPDYWANVEEIDELNVNVYPNPASDILSIAGDLTPDATINVYDQVGKIVLNSKYNNGTDLNISDLESGMYTVVITDNGQQSVKNIIKK